MKLYVALCEEQYLIFSGLQASSQLFITENLNQQPDVSKHRAVFSFNCYSPRSIIIQAGLQTNEQCQSQLQQLRVLITRLACVLYSVSIRFISRYQRIPIISGRSAISTREICLI